MREKIIIHAGRLILYSLSPVIVICCWMKEWLWGSKPPPRCGRNHWQIPGTGSISRWMEMEIMIASASSSHPPLASRYVRTVEISSWDIPEHAISQAHRQTKRSIIDQDYLLLWKHSKLHHQKLVSKMTYIFHGMCRNFKIVLIIDKKTRWQFTKKI